MKYKIEWTHNNPMITFHGDISFQDLYPVDGKIYGDSRFEMMKYIIYNLLDANSFYLNHLDLKVISTLDKSASRWNKKIKLACVSQDNNTKKVTLEYKNLMVDSNWEIGLFDTVDEALAWCKQ